MPGKIYLELPDRGHAWVVALSACVVNGILSGMERMIGLLYVALISEYDITRGEASLPFTVRNSVRYFAGPLAGVLGEIFGAQHVTFFGGVVAALGSCLCCIAPSIQWVVLFWGCIHGLGFALANTLFVVIINHWFKQHRATAFGLVLSGACIGALVLPLFLEKILEEYGIFGCFLLLTGLFLNILPPSLLLKSPLWIKNPEIYEQQCTRYYNQIEGLNAKMDEMSVDCSIPQNNSCRRTSFTIKSEQKCTTIPSFKKSKLLQSDIIMQTHQGVIGIFYRSMDIEKLFQQKEEKSLQNGISNPVFTSEQNVKEKCSQDMLNADPVKENALKRSFLHSLRNIPALYLNPAYSLISLSFGTYFFLFIPVLTTIVDYTRDKGFPTGQEKYLIHTLTICDLFGRLCFGWITDRKILALPIFMTVVFVLQGIFVGLLPLAESLPACIVTVGLYGVAAGVIFVHFPVLLYRYVDEVDQPIAVGCIGIFSSISTFGIPPLIGYFKDYIGSYDGLFYIIAACSIFNGVLWIWFEFYENSKEPFVQE